MYCVSNKSFQKEQRRWKVQYADCSQQSTSSCATSSWQHDLTQDGDIHPNPGPVQGRDGRRQRSRRDKQRQVQKWNSQEAARTFLSGRSEWRQGPKPAARPAQATRAPPGNRGFPVMTTQNRVDNAWQCPHYGFPSNVNKTKGSAYDGSRLNARFPPLYVSSAQYHQHGSPSNLVPRRYEAHSYPVATCCPQGHSNRPAFCRPNRQHPLSYAEVIRFGKSCQKTAKSHSLGAFRSQIGLGFMFDNISNDDKNSNNNHSNNNVQLSICGLGS